MVASPSAIFVSEFPEKNRQPRVVRFLGAVYFQGTEESQDKGDRNIKGSGPSARA
jgi:hypothetical protein